MKDQTLTFQEHAFSVNNILKATGVSIILLVSSFLHLMSGQEEWIIKKCIEPGYSLFTKFEQLSSSIVEVVCSLLRRSISFTFFIPLMSRAIERTPFMWEIGRGG